METLQETKTDAARRGKIGGEDKATHGRMDERGLATGGAGGCDYLDTNMDAAMVVVEVCGGTCSDL
jgi:hypothetical protein